MKPALRKYNKYSLSLAATVFGLNYFLPLTTALADNISQSVQPTNISKQAKPAVKIWQPKRAAGKPDPFIRPIGTPISIIRPGVQTNTFQTKTASGKPAAYRSVAAPIASEQVILQSRDLSTYGPVWQSFSDYLTVPKGCEKIPLFLMFTNGSGSYARFQDIRIKLAGKPLATIKDFNGQGKLTRNLTGAIGVGDTLLVVQAVGPAGAHLSWQFTTPKVEVTNVSPKEISLNSKITISGRNFSEQASVNQVLFDKAIASVISASKTQLQVKVPNTAMGGKVDLIVAVGPSRSKPFKITIKAAPKVDGVNMVSTAPGQQVTIKGQGFSPSSADNQVFFGGVPAQIISSTPESITCIVPEPPNYPVWGVPITVKTKGVDSVESDPDRPTTLNIQVRVFDDSSSR